jgi:hypothetical protein
VSLDHQALAATVLGMVAIVVLALAVLGAGMAVRTALHLADELRAERAWRRTTRTAPLPLADDTEPLAPTERTPWLGIATASGAPATTWIAVNASDLKRSAAPEPGTVAWLYDLHPNATRWESP